MNGYTHNISNRHQVAFGSSLAQPPAQTGLDIAIIRPHRQIASLRTNH